MKQWQLGDWIINERGGITVVYDGQKQLDDQPVARLITDGKIYSPISAKLDGRHLSVQFEFGEAVLDVENPGEYLRLTVQLVPEGTDRFVFGPYLTEKQKFGGLVGAAWNEAGAVCIQSLNPKTMGGFPEQFASLHPWYGRDLLPEVGRDTFTGSAAIPVEGGVVLQCFAQDMTRPATHNVGIGAICGSVAPGEGVSGAEACEVPGEDALIRGASIALIACRREELLDVIGRLEVAEGLPHPTVDGVWAKKCERTSESYMMIKEDGDGYSYDETLDIIRKAGLHCFYSWTPFVSWGHFEIDPNKYEGGDEGLKKMVAQAAEKGLMVGFHTLSNFIHTHDSYVSPVPSEDLLIMDTTTLAAELSAEDTSMLVAERKNYPAKSTLNAIRIGTELIQFDQCEKHDDGWLLTNLTRGAFGTAVSSHARGEKVYRLQDHGYKTLFPNLKVQREMATRIGEIIKYTGVRRMSFDGLEGCLYTGRGEYACSEYVRRVFEIAGSELLCDASMSSHYRWHAHSYFNWGEPYYDYQGRGGMFQYRIHNQEYFTNNLMAHMLGQYSFRLASPKFEATHPEDFEFMLSQTIANNAGLGIDVRSSVLKGYGQTDYLLNLVRIWEDMRFHGEIPDQLREDMKNEYANWHLEECEGGWKLYRLRLQTYDFGYRKAEPFGLAQKAELLVIDRPVPTGELKLRIRVGQPRNRGMLTYLAFHPGWGGFFPILAFTNLAVNAGDYLIYTGGTVIRRYDANYHFLEEIQGEGDALVASGELCGFDTHYACTEGSDIEPFATVFQAPETIYIPRRTEA